MALWQLGSPSNTDPADDGDAITGSAQGVDPPSRAIHCNSDGGITVTMAGPRERELTFEMVRGITYPYVIKAVVSVSGGFTGNIVR